MTSGCLPCGSEQNLVCTFPKFHSKMHSRTPSKPGLRATFLLRFLYRMPFEVPLGAADGIAFLEGEGVEGHLRILKHGT